MPSAPLRGRHPRKRERGCFHPYFRLTVRQLSRTGGKLHAPPFLPPSTLRSFFTSYLPWHPLGVPPLVPNHAHSSLPHLVFPSLMFLIAAPLRLPTRFSTTTSTPPFRSTPLPPPSTTAPARCVSPAQGARPRLGAQRGRAYQAFPRCFPQFELLLVFYTHSVTLT